MTPSVFLRASFKYVQFSLPRKFVSNTLLCVGVWFKLLAFMIVVLVQSFFFGLSTSVLYTAMIEK